MKYTVLWLPAAEQELAAIWVASEKRSEVVRSSVELDRRLTTNPHGEGESRSNGRRITFERPLAMFFRIDDEIATVSVSQVWEFK